MPEITAIPIYNHSPIYRKSPGLGNRNWVIRFNKSPKKRIILENIIHPRVFAIEQQLYKFHQLSDPNAIVIIDAALLIESNNYKNMDRVIVVNCSTSIQIQRVIGRSGKSEESVKSRLKTQMALEEKLKYADYTINNEGTREELKSQVLSLYRLLENLV